MILLPDYDFRLFAINRFGVSVTWDANNSLVVAGTGYKVDDTANAPAVFGQDPGSGTWAPNTEVLLSGYDNRAAQASKIFATLRFQNNVNIGTAGSIILKIEWADELSNLFGGTGILPSSRALFDSEQHGKFVADVSVPVNAAAGDIVQSIRIGF